MKYRTKLPTMSNTRKQTIRNTYHIIYNLNINDVYNTNTLQTSIRSQIENHKTSNRLQELEQKLIDWKIANKEENHKTSNRLQELEQKLIDWKIANKDQHSEESCPICYERIQTSNFIAPPCGHKICLGCYKQTILSNIESANNCCLCRQCIL